jgi:predicted TIM-barrel fold metal-dependent hydrolase
MSLRIADADSHVLEPNAMWERHLDPALRPRAPRVRPPPTVWRADAIDHAARLHVACARAGLAADAADRLLGTEVGARWLEVEGAAIWDGISDEVWRRGANHMHAHYLRAAAAGFDAESHVAAMHAQGVERAYLYPTVGLWLFAIDDLDPGLAAGLVRAYNDWLRTFCAHAPEALRPVGAICRHDPQAMVDEVRRVAAWGWTCVVIRPNPVRGRLLGDPAHEPFWAECARLGVAVAIHEGTHARLPAVGCDRFTTRFARHACSHPMEQMMALLALIEGGVLERHPALRIALLEAGAGWLPAWLWRLDHLEYASLAWEVAANVRMKPSDYVRRQCFISCEPGEPGLEDVVDLLGAGCLLYGSDYPHMDHAPQVQADAATLADRLSPAVARQILWDNPARFYAA